MKIAFFSDCYLDLTGGIVSSINAQKDALEKLGHTVYIFSTGYPRSESELAKLSQHNIFQVPSCRLCFRGLTPVSRRPKIIERWLVKTHPEIKDFDIFYIHYEGGCSIAGLRLARELGVPSVQVMHGREDMGATNIVPFGLRTFVAAALNLFHSWYLPHPIKVRRDNYLADTVAKAKMWTLMVNHANAADYVLTPSDHFRKKLIHYGVTKKIGVFPNGVSNACFLDNPPLRTLAPGQTINMIWHSRVSGEKRIIPFLEALSLFHGKYKLDVYGTGNHFRRAQKYAAKYHLNVRFHGNVKLKSIIAKLPECHLDILVSYNFDTFGMTLIEAEAAGVPVFICDPDMKEVVPDGSFLLSKSPSPEDMAEALDALTLEPEQIQKMSQIMLEHRDEILMANRIAILIDYFELLIKEGKK